MKVRKGDRVRVLVGKDRGVEGVVMNVLPRQGKVLVDGVNVARRHTKPRQQGAPGGIIDKVMPIDASNVAVINPKDGKTTRVGYRFDNEGNKVRICKRTGDDL
ncbi:MAG: 50S ribosomal protein L24 [Acidimicrobiia bacterium]|nr:50S ribosomal protein L24 [Acidimicrobiia bacterium]